MVTMTKLNSLYRSENLLTVLFTSMARVAVLRIFLIDPQRAYYQRQLEAATGLAIRAVQRELEKLTDSGLLNRRVEGKRAYYAIDAEFPGFTELRSLFLKEAEPLLRFRAGLGMERRAQLCFLNARSNKILLVMHDDANQPDFDELDLFDTEIIDSTEFLERLSNAPKKLVPFLRSGEDILGRREDIIWCRIEAAGFQVEKGKGIP